MRDGGSRGQCSGGVALYPCSLSYERLNRLQILNIHLINVFFVQFAVFECGSLQFLAICNFCNKEVGRHQTRRQLARQKLFANSFETRYLAMIEF